ncbi:MAG TPA: TolC family protein [Pyrinomonadaceae bacterium]|nr:TolC family protein [Pyrinomonadaceae bacterium]
MSFSTNRSHTEGPRALLAIFLWLIAVTIAGAQTPTPSPRPDLPPPVQRTFPLPVRPAPDATRIGVEAGAPLSLTLSRAIELALSNNNDIDASRNTAQISDFDLQAARGVYDPFVTAESYYESLTTPTASAIGGAVNGAVTQKRILGSGGISGFNPRYGGNYSALFTSSRTTTSNTNSFLNPQFPSSLVLQYTQPLFRGLRFDQNRRQIEIAKRNIELTDSQLRLRAIETIAGVERAYWDLVFALRNLQVQNDTLRQARRQLASNQRLVDQGVLAPIELVAASSQIYAFEQNIFTAQEAVTRTENTLKTLLLPDRTSAEWTRPLMPVTPSEIDPPRIGLEVAVAEALKNRPELTQLEVAADINRIDQRFFREQKKPQIDLVGSYTAQGLAGSQTPAAINPATGLSRVPPNLVGGLPASLGNLAALDYPSYRLGVNIGFPFKNRTAEANLGRSLVDADRIANNRAQAEKNIEAEVRNALQAVRSAESRLQSSAAARTAAEELFASEERLFRGGTSTFYLVAQRQTELATARARELQARTDLNKAISEFQRSIGNTLTVNNVTVAK